MRASAGKTLFEQLKNNKDIFILVGDLGYGMFDKHFSYFPDQILNVGASEQTMMDMAVGLTYEGKKVFTYTISPFYYRAFETIRTYIEHENLPICMLGSGRDKDYKHDGFSHEATDIPEFFKRFKNIQCYFPDDKIQIPYLIEHQVKEPIPMFVSLKR